MPSKRRIRVLALAIAGLLGPIACGSSSSTPARSTATDVATPPTTQRRVRGRVQTAQGPLESAVVVLTPSPPPHRGNTSPIHQTTNRRGRWSLDDLGPGRYVLTATAPGHSTAQTELVVAADGPTEAPTLTLTPDSEAPRIQPQVQGTVHDMHDAPIAGALVVATNYGTDTHWSFATYSDATGDYRLPIDERLQVITVHHPGHIMAWRSDWTPRNALPIRNVRLEPAATVTGRVVDVHGDPRPGVLVFARPGPEEGLSTDRLHGFVPPVARTDARGRFELAVLAGPVGLTAVGPHGRSRAPTWIERGIGQSGDSVELVVHEGQTISGTIVRGDEPVRGRWVRARSLETRETFEAMSPSGPNGRFTIQGLSAGVYELRTRGLESPVRAIVTYREIDDLVLTLPPGPATHALTLQISPPGYYAVDLRTHGRSLTPRPIWDEATDALGQLTLQSVPQGHYEVVAVASDGRIAKRPLEVGASLPTPVELRAKSYSVLTGTVRDRSGRPQPGLMLYSFRDDRARPTPTHAETPPPVVTDREGRYRVHGLLPGTYWLEVRNTEGPVPLETPDPATHWDRPVVEVKTDDQSLSADLTVQTPSQPLTGTVQDEAGHPQPGVRVLAAHTTIEVDPDDELYGDRRFSAAPTTVTDAQGHFTIPDLWPGPHRVVAVDPRSGAFAQREEVDARAPLTLTLQRPATLEIPITVPKPKPKPKPNTAPVVVVLEGPTTIERTVHLHEGRLSLSRLHAGDYWIGISGPTGMTQTQLTLTPGQTLRRPLTLEPWATVEGRLVAAHDGSPLADAEVTLSPLDTDPAHDQRVIPRLHESAHTDVDGRFVLRRVLPGTRDLYVSDDGGPGQMLLERTIEVTPGLPLDLGSMRARAPVPPTVPQRSTGLMLHTTRWSTLRLLTPDLGPPPPGISDHDEHLWVEHIAPRSPAEAAGLQVGDRLLAIDELRVDDLGHGVVEGALGFGEGIAGHTYVLEIDRAGRPLKIHLKVPPP